MATLVLTVAGGIVGGPIGAAIGATLGQQVDAAIFKPKGREGPRLADLKVQASTYGQQIPQLFGTMRVAGSVIWATDLIERRERRGGGKGRPSVTEYSYAVSLAVALSARPIRAIRRIWADGNLLRGSSGTFQERCIFRWHDGSEDQAADPLIASAVGPASASAFRGLAYAVFEELELGSFGNRIPSLTFEIEADAGSVDAGTIGNVLLGEAGRCVGDWPFAGYAASGDRARDALAPLFEVDGVRLASGPDAWRLAPAALTGAPLPLGRFREARRPEVARDGVERQRAPLALLPGSIRLRHYEPERDYQLGQQASTVAGGGVREERIDLPAVLPAASARALAQRLAGAAADGRETMIWQADLAAMEYEPGDVVTLDDGSAWRLAGRSVRASDILLELKRHQPLPAAILPAEPGVPVTAPTGPMRWGGASVRPAQLGQPAGGDAADPDRRRGQQRWLARRRLLVRGRRRCGADRHRHGASGRGAGSAGRAACGGKRVSGRSRPYGDGRARQSGDDRWNRWTMPRCSAVRTGRWWAANWCSSGVPRRWGRGCGACRDCCAGAPGPRPTPPMRPGRRSCCWTIARWRCCPTRWRRSRKAAARSCNGRRAGQLN